MQTWALWTFWVMAIGVIAKILALGFCDYPIMRSRGTDTINLMLSLAWLMWGIAAIW